LQNNAHLIEDVAHSVEKLYQPMDDSLRFTVEKELKATVISDVHQEAGDNPKLFRDYQDVACPVNCIQFIYSF